MSVLLVAFRRVFSKTFMTSTTSPSLLSLSSQRDFMLFYPVYSCFFSSSLDNLFGPPIKRKSSQKREAEGRERTRAVNLSSFIID